MPTIHPDLAAIQRREFMPPKYRGDAKGDWSPRPGVPLVIKDYAGLCQFGYATKLREERVPMRSDVEMFYSSPVEGGTTVGGAFGEPISQMKAGRTEYVRRIHPCGKCTVCINWRKAKYQRAALGFFRTTAVTVLGTLTYDNSWYARKWREKVNRDVETELARYRENLIVKGKKLPGYDEAIAQERQRLEAEINERDRSGLFDRDRVAEWLNQERSAMVKRLRSSLKERADWSGAALTARIEVLELGARKGRVHLHLLWHWDNVPRGFVRKLKEWLRNDWQHKQGVGFIQLRKVRDDASAVYQCKYIGKFETDVHGQKLYVASGNPVPQSTGYLAKGYARFLATSEAAPDASPAGTGYRNPAMPAGGVEVSP